MRYLIAHPCMNCGEPDPIVLEFHHVAGLKRDAVACLVHDGFEWPTIAAEIAKCVVLCANCHRRQTATSRRHYRARRASTHLAPGGDTPAG
jgi:hypothetical protein